MNDERFRRSPHERILLKTGRVSQTAAMAFAVVGGTKT
jgi:hypothetical protein